MQEIQLQLDEIKELLIANKKVLNIDEVCTYTGLSKNYLYKLTSLNRIPYSKPSGKSLYFDKDRIDEWLLRNPQRSL